jgi:hypothetical protein
VFENAGTVELAVVRGVGSSGIVTIDYLTIAGSAVPGVDFVAASGTLTFATGETRKLIPIAIIDNTEFSMNREFTVQLGNPGGGVRLRDPETVTVTIREDDGGADLAVKMTLKECVFSGQSGADAGCRDYSLGILDDAFRVVVRLELVNRGPQAAVDAAVQLEFDEAKLSHSEDGAYDPTYSPVSRRWEPGSIPSGGIASVAIPLYGRTREVTESAAPAGFARPRTVLSLAYPYEIAATASASAPDPALDDNQVVIRQELVRNSDISIRTDVSSLQVRNGGVLNPRREFQINAIVRVGGAGPANLEAFGGVDIADSPVLPNSPTYELCESVLSGVVNYFGLAGETDAVLFPDGECINGVLTDRLRQIVEGDRVRFEPGIDYTFPLRFRLKEGVSGLYTIELAARGRDPHWFVDDPDASNNVATVRIQVVDPTSSPLCFIATAAYGSWLDPHVVTLRAFRDRWLLTHAPGRAFVDWYYSVSPPVADWIRKREWARGATRTALAPLVVVVSAPVESATVLVMLLLAAWLVRTRSQLKRFSAKQRDRAESRSPLLTWCYQASSEQNRSTTAR